MKIKRKTATKIMARAMESHETCLLAVMDSNEAIEYCSNLDEVNEKLNTQTAAILIYNQNKQALDIIDQVIMKDAQQSIEVFQDTEGVFGLRAYQLRGKLQTPVTLELSEFET